MHQVSVTDIERDGEMGGPALELYKEILTRFPKIELVASAGIRNVDDLEKLGKIGCNGAIVGKAFLEGKIPIDYFRVASKV